MTQPAAPTAPTLDTHTLEWDPPAALTAAKRWTCTACGYAVLDYDGNIYGSAVINPCTPETTP